MNIDKDIEILKKLKTAMDIETGYKTYRLGSEEQQAIENVLKELETKEQMINLMADRISELVEKLYDKKYDKKEVIRLFRSITTSSKKEE